MSRPNKLANLDFLKNASLITLQEYELSRRNSAANLAQQLKTLLHMVVDELVDADLARIARESKAEPAQPALPSDPFQLDK